MTKDVLVTIRGIQKGPDVDNEPMEMTVPGEYYYKNNKHYILYEELMDGEQVTGKNRIKLAPGYMELTKRGMVSVDMFFAEGEKHVSNYQMPYGTIEMGIDTSLVSVEETSDEIRIRVAYVLEFNGEHAADCNISINIKSAEI